MANTSDTSALLCVRDVDFAYADRLVLKHINLDIARGSTLGLVGPNGGGKTTLIRLVVGLLTPTRGAILLDGLSVADACRQANAIGYLPQKADLNTRMPLSLRQLLLLCAGDHADSKYVDYLLSSVGLLDLARDPISTLSGGQLQRLLIARALARRPSILVLDEPTTGIDATSRQQFVNLVRTLRRDLNLTVLLSSHDLPIVNEVCDDIACVNLTLHTHTRPLKSRGDVSSCPYPTEPARPATSE